MRAELAEAVYDYFAEHGFDPVTVDEVAHGVGISRATFFRYFGSKEEAVFVAVHASHFDFPSILRAQQPVDGESSWWRLRRMFTPSTDDAELRPDTLRARIKMISATPTLQSRLTERRQGQRAGVVEALSESEPDVLTARALVAAAFALYDVAWGEWASSTERPFPVLLDELFSRFGPLNDNAPE